MSITSTDFEISDMKRELGEKLLDMAHYGVANLRQYDRIANGWAAVHGEAWRKEVFARAEPDFNAEQKVYNGKAAQNGRAQAFNRKIIAETGFSMEKAPLGPCTVHGISAANRILTLQEEGKIPANMSVRIMSGQHGKTESHVFVVLDKMPVSDDYLKSTDTTGNSIIIDTWYGAQGGPYVMSPAEFTDTVGDYLTLGEPKGFGEEGTRNLFSVKGRNELQLAEDKTVAEDAISLMQKVIAPSIEVVEKEELGEDPVFTAFIKENNDVIQNFKMASEDQKSNLKKAMGLDPRDEILVVKYGMVTGHFDMKVHKFVKDNTTWIGKGDFIALLNRPLVEEATLLDDEVELPPPFVDDTFNLDDVELPPPPPHVEEVGIDLESLQTRTGNQDVKLDEDVTLQSREAMNELDHGEIEQPQPSVFQRFIVQPIAKFIQGIIDMVKSIGR
jgi:hypothetical protein